MYFAPRNRRHLQEQIVTDSTKKTLDEIDFRRDKESLVFQQRHAIPYQAAGRLRCLTHFSRALGRVGCSFSDALK